MEHILLVEDEASVRADLTEILRDEGYSVAAVKNGQEALEWLRAQPAPRLILLDLMMPVMNGWDFRCEQLKDASLAAIPVILLSGTTDSEQHQATLSVAASVTKPIRIDRLLRAIEQLCAAKP
ncbi:MAG TPA: response regulator [Polyangiaceae bacterium]|nr:response regulator [Polyangiaceae bacterium]